MKACTKAGTTCGGCVPLVTQVMKAEMKKQPAWPSTTTCASTSRTRARSCTT
jgi:nitrite reductase (NADH) large subunit